MGIEVLRIEKIEEECKNVKTFYINKKFKFIPGQFIMVWIPNVDEKPFALSYENGFTVQAYGRFTEKLFKLRVGSLIRIRGPFGRGFNLKSDAKKILIISGGIGIASLLPLIMKAYKLGLDIDVLSGFKSKDYIIFRDKIEKVACKYLIATDDGSFGVKGYVTNYVKQFIDNENYDQIFVCGPEIMMKKIFDIINFKVETQYSLTRYIKCGIGVCGSCVLDGKGYLVCKDGPVFYDHELVNTSFGIYYRDETGRRIFF